MLATQNRVSEVDASVAAYSLLGMIHGVVDWFVEDGHLSEGELIDQVQEIALRGLIPASPKPGPRSAKKKSAAGRHAAA